MWVERAPCQGCAARPGLRGPLRRGYRTPRFVGGRFRGGNDRSMGFLIPIIGVIRYVIYIYEILIIASAVLSWLIAFGIVNTYNRTVAMIGDFLYRITEPALRPIRRFLPNLGGLDISPIILLLILWLIDGELAVLQSYVYRY